MEPQPPRTLNQLTKSQILKKLAQFLVSISVFSLLLSNSSALPFSAFPVRLLKHSMDKNLIFLFCNGLLVFLAKFSGLLTSANSSKYSSSSHLEQSFKNYQDYETPSLVMEPQMPEVEKDVVAERSDEGEENVVEEKEEEERREGGNGVLVDADIEVEEDDQVWEEEEEKVLGNECLEEEEEAVGDEGEGNGVLLSLSTDELNKRFEEFIRKMKEEIRIEAQQQLVLVK